MAKGGGGAWKVAYADFVTAMMAFFLVMWIVGQDQDKKEAIAGYFNSPLGIKTMRDAKHPESRASLFESANKGEVLASNAVALGRGRDSHSAEDNPSPSTKLIGDHLFSNEEDVQEWQKQAVKEIRDAKYQNPDDPKEAEQMALKSISSKIREDMVRQLPKDVPEIYRNLIFESLNSVNWEELAEDIVEQTSEK